MIIMIIVNIMIIVIIMIIMIIMIIKRIRLNNFVLKMDFSRNKMPIEIIKEGAFGVPILEAFILILLESGTKIHGKNLII